MRSAILALALAIGSPCFAAPRMQCEPDRKWVKCVEHDTIGGQRVCVTWKRIRRGGK